MKSKTPIINMDFRKLSFVFLYKELDKYWIAATLERKAIRLSEKRKNVPINLPPGICSNKTGRVENKSVWPSCMLRPYIKIAGTRIRDTKMDALRSPRPLKTATLGILSFFFK